MPVRRSLRRFGLVALAALSASLVGGVPAGAAPVVIPVQLTDAPLQSPDHPLPPAGALVAVISWLAPDGTVAKVVAQEPIVNGAVAFDAPPLDRRLRWGISIHEAGEPGVVFRSGPLASLPARGRGPLAMDRGIHLLRGPSVSTDALFETSIPTRLTADLLGASGTPVVTGTRLSVVDGAWRAEVRGHGFAFRQLFDLVPSRNVGEPASIVDLRPRGTGAVEATSFVLRHRVLAARVQWRTLLEARLEHEVDAYLRVIVGSTISQGILTPTTYSVSRIWSLGSDGRLGLRLNAGAVLGGLPPEVVIAST